MIRLLDHFVIAVKAVWDEGSSGIRKMNPAFFIDKERDRYERKLTSGIILNKPLVYRETPHMPLDPGIPTPRRYVSHDDIQAMVMQGYPWGQEQYNPSTNENVFSYVTVADYGRMIDVKIGSTVYFHPSVTEEDNYLGEHDGMALFKAAVTEIVFSDGIPQGGYVILKPMAMEQASLITSLDPEDSEKLGTVAYARSGSEFTTGMLVMFVDNANWEFWIEGERYYAMREDEIILTGQSEPASAG